MAHVKKLVNTINGITGALLTSKNNFFILFAKIVNLLKLISEERQCIAGRSNIE